MGSEPGSSGVEFGYLGRTPHVADFPFSPSVRPEPMTPPLTVDDLAAVPLPQACRLLNHGPTVLVAAAHAGRRNVMAAAWNMPLDFDPPKVAVVLDKSTFTRRLIAANGGRFVLAVPCRAQASLVSAVGAVSGAEVDKDASVAGLAWLDEAPADAPMPVGCVAWLACRRLPEPAIEQAYDLFVAQVTAAWSDPRAYSEGRWHFAGGEDLRTLHHVAGGHYLVPGDWVR